MYSCECCQWTVFSWTFLINVAYDWSIHFLGPTEFFFLVWHDIEFVWITDWLDTMIEYICSLFLSSSQLPFILPTYEVVNLISFHTQSRNTSWLGIVPFIWALFMSIGHFRCSVKWALTSTCLFLPFLPFAWCWSLFLSKDWLINWTMQGRYFTHCVVPANMTARYLSRVESSVILSRWFPCFFDCFESSQPTVADSEWKRPCDAVSVIYILYPYSCGWMQWNGMEAIQSSPQRVLLSIYCLTLNIRCLSLNVGLICLAVDRLHLVSLLTMHMHAWSQDI